MTNLPHLSVIIITKNEAKNIAECLNSVTSIATEIIVVDSGSTDGTQKICIDLGATLLEADWPGFGPQKNRALDLAVGDWILSIDADERVTPELASEIQSILAQPNSLDAYSFPRLSSYCGQFMRHGGWFPDRVTRLFRRGKARFSNDIVHESLQTENSVGRLNNNLIHISYRTIEDVLIKMNQYTTAGAEKLAHNGRSATPAIAVTHGIWTFFRTYLLHFGFLDGNRGLMLAISNAEGTYYKYIKLWLLSQKNDI